MADHDKPVWFITGCSTGFGRELARLLLAQGYRVAATARDAASLADLQAGNPNALALALDVTKSEAITQAVRAAEEKFGRIDVLVNNAGMIAPQCRLEALGFERMQRIFAVNAIGPILCAQQAVKRMSYRHPPLKTPAGNCLR